MTPTEPQSQQPSQLAAPLKKRLGIASIFNSPGRMAVVYLAGLALAEAITTLIEARFGMIMHGLVLAALFLHASIWANFTQRRFLLCLSMAPMIRLVSLALPLMEFPFVYWYMIVGLPLFLAAYLAVRASRLNRGMLNLSYRSWPLQLLIAPVGIGLGYIEFLILRPDPLISELSLSQALLPSIILLIFTGFLEELIFRGMLQYSAMRSFGRSGLIYSAVVFTVLHLGYHSIVDLIFVFGVAILFGLLTYWTGSILGVSLAHGITNIGLYLVFPFLITVPMVTPRTAVGLTPAIPAPIMIVTLPSTPVTPRRAQAAAILFEQPRQPLHLLPQKYQPYPPILPLRKQLKQELEEMHDPLIRWSCISSSLIKKAPRFFYSAANGIPQPPAKLRLE